MGNKKKVKLVVEYPEPPFKAVLVDLPKRDSTLIVGDIYDIVDVVDYLGKQHFVVQQNIRGQQRETYWLAERFDVEKQ